MNTSYEKWLTLHGIRKLRPDEEDALNQVLEGLFDMIISLKMEVEELKQ